MTQGSPGDNHACPFSRFATLAVFLHVDTAHVWMRTCCVRQFLFTSPLEMCKPTPQIDPRCRFPALANLEVGTAKRAHLPRKMLSSKCSWHHVQAVPTKCWNLWPPWKRSPQLRPPGWIPLMGGPGGIKKDLIHITESWLITQGWGSGGF